MAKILNAQKQKDTRTLSYDPEKDSLTLLISEFQLYNKNTKFINDYSEMEKFHYFKEFRWMKTMDEKLQDQVQEFSKRQKKLNAKYKSYIEYSKWSESPYATKTKPLTKWNRIIIISVFIILVSIMLLIVIGLNKLW